MPDLYSISVLQWLLNADSSSHSPPQRLTKFFTTLHSALRNPSRAVFQFYPSSDDQVQLITQSAQRAGFGGGIVVDYPNSKKARKMYLCLMVGSQEVVPSGIVEGEEMTVESKEKLRQEVRNERRRRKEKTGGSSGKKRKNTEDKGSKEWILKKKDLYRTRGKEE
jgi:18S rRNA (guanine1575-N7)-methyltransferase